MANQEKPTLTIGKIVEKKESGEYLAKDVFTHKKILMTMSGKERMCFTFKKDDIVYIAESTLLPGKGRLMTGTSFKRQSRDYLHSLKDEVDKKYKKLKLIKNH